MELTAASEEAKQQREEAIAARADLARSEANLFRSQRRVKELETVNRLLRTQLVETQETFRHALQTAQKYIVEGLLLLCPLFGRVPTSDFGKGVF